MPTIVKSEAANVDDIAIPTVPELDRLRLHNLVLQHQVLREQLNVLTLQFLQTPQPNALQERVEDVTKQINGMAERLFAEANLDPRRYQLNVEDGRFVERSQRS